MRKNSYDVIILGGGIAGAFAAYKLSQQSDVRACLIEFGRQPFKRRKQLEGWLGCLPQSNSRLYLDNINDIKSLAGNDITDVASKYVFSILEKHGTIVPEKNKEPFMVIKNKLNKLGYELSIDNYIQWLPASVHLLSRTLAKSIYKEDKVRMIFDNEIMKVTKNKQQFIVETEQGIFLTKNILLCMGRSGWRFANNLFNSFGLIKSDDYATFGVRCEVPENIMKDWNGSSCSLQKNNMFINRMSWNGTNLPEDHLDLVISNWRSNENRWHTNKVSFSVNIKQKFDGEGLKQTERLAKLAYILSDNRIGKGKIKEFLKGMFDITHIPEYSWFKSYSKELDKLIPGFIEKGNFYIPDIKIDIPEININPDFSTNMKGLYVAGENAGKPGILSACLSGCMAIDSIYNRL